MQKEKKKKEGEEEEEISGPKEKLGGTKEKKKGKGGDGGKQMMKDTAETRREKLVEYGDSLIVGLEEKFVKFFDEDKKDLLTETVKSALDFYEVNWTQSYNEDIFNEKKQEISAAWEEIIKLCRAEWAEENKDQLAAQAKQRQLDERRERMRKLGIKEKPDTNTSAAGGGGTSENNNNVHTKPKALSQKQRLKEIKQKMLEEQAKSKQTADDKTKEK